VNYNLIVIGQAKRPIIVRCSKKRVKVMQREKTSRRFWDSVMPIYLLTVGLGPTMSAGILSVPEIARYK